ncbi:MAG TPA: sulfate adenylyltransferase [Nitrospiria bacterium]|jgi:sulfate adenylyltransferase|nr:sulfate adenylyltransferase [Nitrospiria bacterium]
MTTNTPHHEIPAHGGRLISRLVQGAEQERLMNKALEMKKIPLTRRKLCDLEMLAVGAYSPLEGYMGRKDYERVVTEMHLSGGLPWSIPITFRVDRKTAESIREGQEIALTDERQNILAILHLEEKFEYDKKLAARAVYRTDSAAHPGVDILYKRGDILLGGKVSVVRLPENREFLSYRLTPAETRAIFKDRGWKTVVGFQTRNPVHRAHEYIQKCALEIVDGLLLHPLIGETKSDDIPADVRMRCYEALLERYYPKNRVVLSVLPAPMRYAGPREAIHHAIVRKNYGCTHFIVGRDHAGVGSFYGSFDAHHIFNEFAPGELGITPLFFDNTFYCKACGSMASVKTCPHDKNEHVSLSGTKVREMLRAGTLPPPEFSRPEVAKILIEAMKNSG